MTRTSSFHLIDMLAEVPDPRNKKGKRHPLKSILALVVIGLMCGHNGWTSIATWARSQPALAKVLGFTYKKTPCAATIHNLLKKLDVVALEATLTKWVNTVIQNCRGSEFPPTNYPFCIARRRSISANALASSASAFVARSCGVCNHCDVVGL